MLSCVSFKLWKLSSWKVWNLSPQAHSSVIEHVKVYLDLHGSCAKAVVEAVGLLDMLEKCIKKALTDANTGGHQNACATFWSFEALWKV